MVVAIDGPAGSGKGTVARRLAEYYGAFHLDSGKLYRLFATRAEAKHVDVNLPRQIEAVFRDLDLGALDNLNLSSHLAGTLAAKYSPNPVVRKYINETIRRLARERTEGIVVDGRDIGTVVLPSADVKLFVTADPQERARRRLSEVQGTGQGDTYEKILADLISRDRADTKRKVAPLRQADDAVLLDTTNLNVEQAVAAAIEIVERRRGG